MSIEGQLTIQLSVDKHDTQCKLSSSRPLHVSRLFMGKPIDAVLKLIPMLFNICGKAQTIAALRAVESSLNQEVDEHVENQREALIWLESLREQLWRIILEYPKYLDEPIDAELMAFISQAINEISQGINRNESLLSRGSTVNTIVQQTAWSALKKRIEVGVLGGSSSLWLGDQLDIECWGRGKQTCAARFVFWLQQQSWKHAGASSIQSLNTWDDLQLQQRLKAEMYEFTHMPSWKGQAHEVSWFSSQRQHPLIDGMLEKKGNGIYTRVIARMVGIADLMQKLDHFFHGGKQEISYPASKGMAHVNAARGRLTHCIQMNAETVDQLTILAPTEWNFHPEGVAAKGMENLQGDDVQSLETQAHCLIHAIDPCVGYQLSVTKI